MQQVLHFGRIAVERGHRCSGGRFVIVVNDKAALSAQGVIAWVLTPEGTHNLGTLVVALSLHESQELVQEILLSLAIAIPVVLLSLEPQ